MGLYFHYKESYPSIQNLWQIRYHMRLVIAQNFSFRGYYCSIRGNFHLTSNLGQTLGPKIGQLMGNSDTVVVLSKLTKKQ